MRQIKFRYWDNENKEMNGWVYRIDGDGNIYERNHHGWDKAYNIIPLQFTGLLDKNGKEIYEGDICRDDRGYISVVEYTEEHGRIGYDLHLAQEVILGNIYENPELLENKS